MHSLKFFEDLLILYMANGAKVKPEVRKTYGHPRESGNP